MLYQSLCLNDSDLWLTFSRSSCCEQEIPPPIAKKISIFQQVSCQSTVCTNQNTHRALTLFRSLSQVLVVQALRPDRLQSAMAAFASQALGKFRERRHTHTHTHTHTQCSESGMYNISDGWLSLFVISLCRAFLWSLIMIQRVNSTFRYIINTSHTALCVRVCVVDTGILI